jgi:hypothetical protein
MFGLEQADMHDLAALAIWQESGCISSELRTFWALLRCCKQAVIHYAL